MKRFVCSKCNAPLRKKAICSSCGYNNEHLARKMSCRRILKVIITITLVVGSIVLCNALLLFPWQWGARKNKQAILEYAAERYPEAVVLEQHYNTLNFNFLKSPSDDYIFFKQDFLEFGIYARGGKITIDDYPRIRANAQFDKIIRDDFFEPRGIEVQTDYNYSDDYYEIYPYTGGLGVTVRISDQGATPQEIGCLYDFYKFWKEKSYFLENYSVYIDIVIGNEHHAMRYNKSSEFANEEEFYAIFE